MSLTHNHDVMRMLQHYRATPDFLAACSSDVALRHPITAGAALLAMQVQTGEAAEVNVHDYANTDCSGTPTETEFNEACWAGDARVLCKQCLYRSDGELKRASSECTQTSLQTSKLTTCSYRDRHWWEIVLGIMITLAVAACFIFVCVVAMINKKREAALIQAQQAQARRHSIITDITAATALEIRAYIAQYTGTACISRAHPAVAPASHSTGISCGRVGY